MVNYARGFQNPQRNDVQTMKLLRISDDLEWIEVEPNHWVLYRKGEPYIDLLDDVDDEEE
jgi:hypothetical protein